MGMIEEKVSGILTDIWHNAIITSLETQVCDLLVEFTDKSLQFVVEVKSKSSFTKELFEGFINNEAWAIFRQGAPKIPVVIALLDEVKNVVEIGIAVSWRFGTPIICQDIKFTIVSKENSDVILDNIKAADEVIRTLESTNCKVLKQISFKVPVGQFHLPGRLIYLRNLQPDYKMNCKKPQNQKEEFERFLHGIQEEEYPRDKVDDIILESVASKYPNAEPHSKLLLFSSELRDLKEHIERSIHHKACIVVEPSADINVLATMIGESIADLDLDIYMEAEIQGKKPETNFSSSLAVSSAQEYYNFKRKISGVSSISDLCL